MSFFCIVFNEKNQETSTNILGVSVLGGTRWNPSEPVQICPDPFEHVETCYNRSKHVSIRSDLLEHVTIRWDMLEHVQTCWNTFRPVETTRFQASPLLPLPLPLFPFLFFWGGGGRGRVGSHHHHRPPEGGGGRSPPPLRILTTTKNFFLSKYSNLQHLCNLPTLEVSLSPLLLKTTKLMKNVLNKKQNSLWHTEMIWNLKSPPPPKYY